MRFSAALVILTLVIDVAHADIFRNDFLPVGHARTDAIINPDCLSDHVHTFYGPPLLYPALTFEDLRNSDPSLSSGNIEENNSLYWHPAVYHVADNGKKTLQESGECDNIDHIRPIFVFCYNRSYVLSQRSGRNLIHSFPQS